MNNFEYKRMYKILGNKFYNCHRYLKQNMQKYANSKPVKFYINNAKLYLYIIYITVNLFRIY